MHEHLCLEGVPGISRPEDGPHHPQEMIEGFYIYVELAFLAHFKKSVKVIEYINILISSKIRLNYISLLKISGDRMAQ